MNKEIIPMSEDEMDKLYNSKNPLVRFIHTNRLNQIIKLIKNKENLKILDAGCGEGHLIQKLQNNIPNNTYYGFDITDIALEKAKIRCTKAIIEKKDLANTKTTNDFFDIIICSEVLEHIPEYQEVINELKRILQKDGLLIITFPNETLWTVARFFLGRKPIKEPQHVNSFTPNKMKSYINLKTIKQINLPFRLPFILSLGSIIKFKK